MVALQPKVKTRRPAGRTADCTGGCGKVIHRCHRVNPVCVQCERDRVRRRSLAPPEDSEVVSLRMRQKADYLTAVLSIIRRQVRRFRRRNGRLPTGGERMRLEHRVMAVLRRLGVETNSSNLPKPQSEAWREMLLVLESMAPPVKPNTEAGNGTQHDGGATDARPPAERRGAVGGRGHGRDHGR